MARIDAAYNYFMSVYGKDIGNRYESHKKSELRNTYNKIVKANKDSPLYKINDTEDLGQFAIDIKENANNILNAVSNLSSDGDNIESVLSKRIAYSSDSNSVDVLYVGDDDSSADNFTVEVNSLATPQINVGNFLVPTGHDFEEGQYAFDLDTRNHSYEFQYNVNKGDTNLDIQSKIIRLINNSDVGLSADMVSNGHGQNAIRIESKTTGLAEDETYIFSISSNTNWREMNTLGIDQLYAQATNSSFKLNDNSHTSMSNTFTVNKSYELVLKNVTTEPVSVGLMSDTEALAKGISQMLASYNGMIDVGLRYTGAHQNRTLFNEISSVGRSLSDSLSTVGISSDELNHLTLDKNVLSDAINSTQREQAFSTLNTLKSAMGNAASKASINPIAYVDKSICEYKNPGKTLAAPYAASQYSGMMVSYDL